MAQNMKCDVRTEDNVDLAAVNVIPHHDVSHLDKKARPASANLDNSLSVLLVSGR